MSRSNWLKKDYEPQVAARWRWDWQQGRSPFSSAIVASSGLEVVREGPGFFTADELFVSTGEPTAGLHLAFQARDRETVHRFHEAVLAAGGTDNGGPGERSYHPGYYSAYALDPDGNNVEAVHHGPSRRSAESIVFEPA